jgi:hypothetical protein
MSISLTGRMLDRGSRMEQHERRCGARRRAACRPARCSRRQGPLPLRTGVGDGDGTMRPTSRSRRGAICLRLVDKARRELVINLKRSPARRKDAAHRRTGSAWRRTGTAHGEIMAAQRRGLGCTFRTANRVCALHGQKQLSERPTCKTGSRTGASQPGMRGRGDKGGS